MQCDVKFKDLLQLILRKKIIPLAKHEKKKTLSLIEFASAHEDITPNSILLTTFAKLKTSDQTRLITWAGAFSIFMATHIGVT